MFPLGFYPYIIGGIIIGIGVSIIYITTGLHATQSSFFLTFAAGVLLGAFLYTITLATEGFFTTSVEWWRLAIGGFLVGFGTRLSKGCTSGHGISGLASLSTTSLFAVITFITVGILTALFVQNLGVLP
jgi:uncharacterized membrane protein YedE/YeeE